MYTCLLTMYEDFCYCCRFVVTSLNYEQNPVLAERRRGDLQDRGGVLGRHEAVGRGRQSAPEISNTTLIYYHR